jgi:hypothetical protein
VILAGVALAGVPAEVTPGGIKVADQAPVSPVSLAEFNAALAQLEAQGITVVTAPLLEETATGAARASGGALRIRYKVADQIGGDEELTLAPATAKSAVSRRDAEPADVPAADLPLNLDAHTDAAPTPVAATTPSVAALDAPIPTPTAFDAPGLPFAGSPPFADTPASAASATAPTAAGGVVSPPASEDVLLAAGRGSDPAGRLRSGYAIVLLAALAGLATVTLQFRIRPA